MKNRYSLSKFTIFEHCEQVARKKSEYTHVFHMNALVKNIDLSILSRLTSLIVMIISLLHRMSRSRIFSNNLFSSRLSDKIGHGLCMCTTIRGKSISTINSRIKWNSTQILTLASMVQRLDPPPSIPPFQPPETQYRHKYHALLIYPFLLFRPCATYSWLNFEHIPNGAQREN